MNRRTVSAGALLTLGLVLTGCTGLGGGKLTGPSQPPPDSGSASTADPTKPGTTEQTESGCARSAKPAECAEWTDTTPESGDKLFAVRQQDPVAAAQMLCSSLPTATWEKYLGKKVYRVVQGESRPACVVSAGDDQLVVGVSLLGGSPLAEYVARYESDATLAPIADGITVAGVPAMRTANKADTDGVDVDREDLLLAPTGTATDPGVLHVQLTLRPARGKPQGTPVDRSRLEVRDAITTDLLKALFPKN